ncbi:MAG: DUF1523 family protein [Pseudomonadota bacterium]
MKYLRHIPALLIFVIGAVLLNYYLPDRDIVQVVGTEVIRFDIEPDAPFWERAQADENAQRTRDVRLINTEKANGKPMVYRNEDTGWGFPPYFKFDSDNVFTQAKSFERQPDQWVAVRHYGWRIEIFSIYPNATSMKRVDGPDVRLIPWFNIVFIGLLLTLWFFLWRAVRRWKAKRIDPTLNAVGDTIGDAARDVSDSVEAGSERVRGRWRKIFGSPKPK